MCIKTTSKQFTFIFLFLLIYFVCNVLSFTNLDLSDADNIKIVHPQIHHHRHRTPKANVRHRRSNDIHKSNSIAPYVVIEMGDWFVQLNLSDNLLIAPGFKTEWVDINGKRTRLTASSDDDVEAAAAECDYFMGMVTGLEVNSNAAITICGQSIMGFINMAGMAFFIQPLNVSNGAHVFYTSKRLKRNTPKQWLFNLTGDVIDIDMDDIGIDMSGDENVLDDNEQQYDRNEVAAGDIHESSTVFETQQNFSNDTEWFRQQLDDEDAPGYFYDPVWTASKIYTRKSPNTKMSTRWLEIAIAVDYTLISFHGRNKVEQYVLSLMNIVSAIYQDPSLGANLKLVITRILLFDNKKQSVVRPGNAKRSLENVNGWNKRLYMSLAPGEPQHDLAVWLTRSDIGGPSGYAPVGGVCDPRRSCALNRDEGLTSAFIIAHETAHILGLSHDGDNKAGNGCGDKAADGSVMAPMVAATFSKFFWSECSKKEFEQHSHKWTCLLNSPTDSGEIQLNATLENSFTMDEQCRAEFGDGYAMCRAFEIIEPCSHLWCGHTHQPLVCKTKQGPPLEGTECGFGKWCVNGYCEDVNQRRYERVAVVLNPQDGGWSDWSNWGPCSRSCGVGVEFRSRKCNNPTPSYGGKNCNGLSEEWRTCNKFSCPEPLSDIRAEQCRRLPKLLNLTGMPEGNFTWLPFESSQDDLKCKFICLSEETKELYDTSENLLDGSPCSYEHQNKICVQGTCHEIGCNGELNSKKQFDRCGVCNGNNMECVEKKFRIKRKLKREVSRIAVFPRMSREIQIEINATMDTITDPPVAFILKNRRRKKFIITIPNTIIHTQIIEGTRFFYNKNQNNHLIWAKGPVLAEMIILIYASSSEIQLGLNVSTETRYTVHRNYLIPSKRYVWIKGGWGPCSASCGGGRRQKTTACWDNHNNKLVRRKFCSLLGKPAMETEKCNIFECDFEWIVGQWEPCSATCGTKGVQHREIYCVPKSVLTKLSFRHNGTVLDQPWKYMVNPNRCFDMSPLTEQYCNRIPCRSYWTFGEWSQCSASCGAGVSTRVANCPAPKNESFFSCGESLPYQKRICEGPYNRHNNILCKGRKKRYCKSDESDYCSIPLLMNYCKINSFRRICCKTCSRLHHLTPISA